MCTDFERNVNRLQTKKEQIMNGDGSEMGRSIEWTGNGKFFLVHTV